MAVKARLNTMVTKGATAIWYGLVLCMLLSACETTHEEEPVSAFKQSEPIEVTELFRIGNEQDLLFQFGTTLVVDSAGRLFISDPPFHLIRVFSASGDSLGVIGSEGEGPGEFRMISGIGMDHADSLYVWDFHLRRVTVFSPGLQPKASRTFRLKYRPEGGIGDVLKPDTTGFVFLWASYPNQDWDKHLPLWLSWSDAQGNVVQDSILLIPPVQHLIERWEGGESMIRIPFARHPIVRLGRDNRIYYGWTENLEIEAYSLEGELLQTIRLPSRPIALTDAELNEAIEELGGGRFGGRKVQALKQIELPKTRPAFNDLVIGEGQMWIKVPDRLDSLSTWQVVDLSKQEVARCFLPEQLSIKVVRHGFLYAMERMGYDQYEVVVYRINDKDS